MGVHQLALCCDKRMGEGEAYLLHDVVNCPLERCDFGDVARAFGAHGVSDGLGGT